MQKEIKWSYAHFPIGTIVEVKVFNDPYQLTVKEIVCNGADSYCIIADTSSEIHGCSNMVNINYVTKIIKRGDGDVNIKKEHRNITGQSSHRSRYSQKFNMHLIITNFLSKNCPIDANVDYDKFEKIVLPFIKYDKRNNDFFKIASISKKKLKKLVKQNINRCLMPKKVAIAFEESLYEDGGF